MTTADRLRAAELAATFRCGAEIARELSQTTRGAADGTAAERRARYLAAAERDELAALALERLASSDPTDANERVPVIGDAVWVRGYIHNGSVESGALEVCVKAGDDNERCYPDYVWAQPSEVRLAEQSAKSSEVTNG